MNAGEGASAGEINALAERRRFGMWLFLASLGMLFGGSLVGFIVIRSRAPEWPPAGSPDDVFQLIPDGIQVAGHPAAGRIGVA